MKHDIIDGIDRYTADDGMGFIRNDDFGIVSSTELWLPKTDSIDNFSELPLGTVIDPKQQTRYYTVDLLIAIGSVCGDSRYDSIKETFSKTRINCVPIWDMFISGMYIPSDDPRLETIRKVLIDGKLLTNEEFNKILELSKSNEDI